MSYKIRPKRSITSGAVPSANVLDIGELAINLADGILFTKDDSNSIVSLSSNAINAVQAADTLYVGNLIPKQDNFYTLGTPGNVWSTLYVAANTILIGSTALQSDGQGGILTLQANSFTGEIVSADPVLQNTSNIIEGANLYFTNARAVAALTAGTGITVESNGLIIATESQAISTGSQVEFIETLPSNTLILDRNVNVASDIFVIVNGLIQVPTTDYTISGNVLTFIANVPANSTVEVRYIFL